MEKKRKEGIVPIKSTQNKLNTTQHTAQFFTENIQM